MNAMTPPSDSGCMLTEEQRLYYLDAIGVSTWYSLQQPSSAATDGPGSHGNTVAGAATPAEPVMQPAASRAQATAAGAGDNEAAWVQLEQAVAACTRCDLHASRTQTVFGVGSHQAQLLIIGEAPGQEEDRQGEPFVGRAGQLLNSMLKAIGLRREQVYIANILKCRPPGNRDPFPQEAACCNPWLRQQIELLQPAVIFAIGRIAAQTLLETDAAVGAMRGRRHDYAGVPLVVGYHPAYLLRRPIEKRKAWQDLTRVRTLLEAN
jgi:DNA polymerase